jgi:hypothetical protein
MPLTKMIEEIKEMSQKTEDVTQLKLMQSQIQTLTNAQTKIKELEEAQMTKDTEIADLRKDLIGALRNQAVDTNTPPEVKTVDPYQKWKESVVK